MHDEEPKETDANTDESPDEYLTNGVVKEVDSAVADEYSYGRANHDGYDSHNFFKRRVVVQSKMEM